MMATTDFESMQFSMFVMGKFSDVMNPGWSMTLEIATQFLLVGVGT